MNLTGAARIRMDSHVRGGAGHVLLPPATGVAKSAPPRIVLIGPGAQKRSVTSTRAPSKAGNSLHTPLMQRSPARCWPTKSFTLSPGVIR